MDVLVCLKRVPLAGGTLILTPDSRDIETKHLGFGISPHEENAVEAGVQLVEQMGGTLTLLTLGPSDAEEQLRSQLAIGATRAVLIETDGQEWDPQGTAAALVDAINYGIAKGHIPAKNKVIIDSIAAISVGIIDGEPMLDLAYTEDVRAETDMNVVVTGSGKFVEVQGTAEGAAFDRDELNALLDLALLGTAELTRYQADSLIS
jgi:hypothetical protein